MRTPEYQGLGVRTARLVMPWDGVTKDPWTSEDWLLEARRAGAEPMVTFEHSQGDACPSAPCHLPSRAEFDAQFQEFHRRYPEVRIYGAWNEPSHTTQPTDAAPGHAAWYAQVIEQRCPECTVVTEVLLGSPGLDQWLQRYLQALGHGPQVWGLHAYRDANEAVSTQTQDFLARYQGRVWLTEIGGIVRFSKDGRVVYPYDEARAAEAIDRSFDLVERLPQIERMYLYHWFPPGPGATWDSALMGTDGPRPAFARLQARLAVRPSEIPADAPPVDLTTPEPVVRVRPERAADPAPDSPAQSTARADAPVIARVPRRWRRARGTSIRVSVSCHAAAACRVAIGLRARGRQASSVERQIPAGQTAAVRIRVPAALWTRTRRSGATTVWVRVASGDTLERFPVRLAWR